MFSTSVLAAPDQALPIPWGWEQDYEKVKRNWNKELSAELRGKEHWILSSSSAIKLPCLVITREKENNFVLPTSQGCDKDRRGDDMMNLESWSASHMWGIITVITSSSSLPPPVMLTCQKGPSLRGGRVDRKKASKGSIKYIGVPPPPKTKGTLGRPWRGLLMQSWTVWRQAGYKLSKVT